MDKSIYTFPYQRKRSEFGNVFDPLITLAIKTVYGLQSLWFLVDSGADMTLLNCKLAKQLGLPFDTHKKTLIYGIGETPLNAYLGKIIIQLGLQEITIRSYFLETEDSTLLLGRLDIFDRFIICFDPHNEKIILEYI